MAPGLHGIPEAVGADRAGVDSVANFGGPETLPASAVAAAQVVIVPGLAGGRDGSRLGTGGGWYDEALGFRDPAAEVWLLLFDGEVFDSVPSEPHDVPVTRIFTPSGRIVIEM
jgi:5-formyltetrahydrofolate cyclo-ligase